MTQTSRAMRTRRPVVPILKGMKVGECKTWSVDERSENTFRCCASTLKWTANMEFTVNRNREERTFTVYRIK